MTPGIEDDLARQLTLLKHGVADDDLPHLSGGGLIGQSAFFDAELDGDVMAFAIPAFDLAVKHQGYFAWFVAPVARPLRNGEAFGLEFCLDLFGCFHDWLRLKLVIVYAVIVLN